MQRSPPRAVAAVLSLSVCTASAQEAPRPVTEPARAEAAALAIRTWVDAYVHGGLEPGGEVWFGRWPSVDYLRVALDGAAIPRPDKGRKTTHFSVLQRIVSAAERMPDAVVTEALIALAAAVCTNDMYGGSALLVRDLGYFAIMRRDSASVWHRVVQIARGAAAPAAPAVVAAAVEDPPAGRTGDAEELEATARVMRRVVAVRLLGGKRNPVFRPILLDCLEDPDPRIRMAAAEGFEALRDVSSLYDLARRATVEEHALVVTALLAAVDATLRRFDGRIPISHGLKVVRMLLPVLGRRGWRNDMAIVELVRRYPLKESIPAMIHVLRGAQAELDPILKILDEKASPILADAAFQALRGLTGALIPADPDRWQEFWAAEKDRLVVVAPYRRRRGGSTSARGSFFGIEVVGREVVFVIDTSGSMKERVGRGTAVPGAKDRVPTRLGAALAQTLNAVQGVSAGTRYHLVTFSDHVRVWNRAPVPQNESSSRALTEALARLAPEGGTNLFEALFHVLRANQSTYGQKLKTGIDEVFVLTDGEPSVGLVKDPDEILRLVREANRYRKVRINTVFTGVGKGADFLRKLAEQNYGQFVRK